MVVAVCFVCQKERRNTSAFCSGFPMGGATVTCFSVEMISDRLLNVGAAGIMQAATGPHIQDRLFIYADCSWFE